MKCSKLCVLVLLSANQCQDVISHMAFSLDYSLNHHLWDCRAVIEMNGKANAKLSPGITDPLVLTCIIYSLFYGMAELLVTFCESEAHNSS